MPTPRRRPVPPAVPVRHARVAGLRHPAAPARPAEPDAVDRVTGEITDDAVAVEDPAVDDAVVDDAVADRVVDDPPARPRPTGKARPRPRPRPASEDDLEPPADPPGWQRPRPAADDADEPDATGDAGETRRRSPLLVPIALAVVTVLLGGVATAFALMWTNQRDGAVAGNTALTDNAGTAEVKGQVTSAINTTFSYDYNDVGKTERAAKNLLTGTALCQYNDLFKVIQQQAPAQKLVLTTQVTASGVQVLSGDTARVLLVVDQSDRRASTNQPVRSQAALAVNAVRQGGAWKISGIDTFNGTANTPGCH